MIWYLLIIPIVYLLFQWHGKVEFYEMKTGKGPLKAKVIEYTNDVNYKLFIFIDLHI